MSKIEKMQVPLKEAESFGDAIRHLREVEGLMAGDTMVITDRTTLAPYECVYVSATGSSVTIDLPKERKIINKNDILLDENGFFCVRRAMLKK